MPGITRATVFEICDELGIDVTEKLITTGEVKEADAAFFCGTAAEVVGWKSLDGVQFKMDWDRTGSKKIQEAYSARVVEADIAEEILH